MHTQTEIIHEVLEMHTLFQAWYQGSLQESDLVSKIGVRLAEDFQIVFPDRTEHKRGDLLEMMRTDRGNDPQYRIVIDDIELQNISSGTYRVRYRESQYWKGSIKPNLVIQTLSVLINSPDGLRWKSIHETKVD